MKDQIYSQLQPSSTPFAFDARVAEVFDDMIRRSVPGYEQVIGLQAELLAKILPQGAQLTDLGCSTVKLYRELYALRKDLEYLGIDPSEDMLSRAQRACVEAGIPSPNLRAQQAQEVDLRGSWAVALNFVLQFIPVQDRQIVLQQVYDALPKGGVLLLSEKIVHSLDWLRDAQIEVYHDYKRSRGYSDLEIQQKRDALEDVLVPETFAAHETRLKTVGFDCIEVNYKWLNFCSWMAVKS